jgi:hypothetical protein
MMAWKRLLILPSIQNAKRTVPCYSPIELADNAIAARREIVMNGAERVPRLSGPALEGDDALRTLNPLELNNCAYVKQTRRCDIEF